MYTWDYNLFIGDDTTDIHVGFATGERTFIIGEVKAEDEGDSLKDSLNHLKDILDSSKPNSLDAVVKVLEDGIKELSSTLVSLATAYVADNVIYVVTKGSGEVFVARRGQLNKLLSGENTASGIVEDGDYFLLANKTFTSQVDNTTLQKLMFNTKPQEIVETITPELKATNNVGMIALFMQSAKQKNEEIDETEEDETAYAIGTQEVVVDESEHDVEQPQPIEQPAQPPEPSMAQDSKLKALLSKVKLPSVLTRFQQTSSRGRRVTLAIVVVLIAILSWSVISGNARREKANFLENVTTQKQTIETKMSEAKDLAGVNTQKSLTLIDESRGIITELEQTAQQKKYEDVPEIAEMTALVNETEQSIRKVEEGQYTEYYDLELVSKGAGAKKLYSDGETLAMLDTESSKLYMLDIAEKSVTSYSSGKISDASLIAIHQRVPYIYGKDIGVVKMTSRTEDEEVLSASEDLGSVKDFWMYLGNIYLLDSSEDDIHKYLVAEEGYSSQRSYFGEGQDINLKDATAMAIDGSVYVSAGDATHKYVGGVREVFSISVPDGSDITYEDVYSDRDTDYVYFLDKDSARIIIATKDGDFEKQLSASVLKNADDFVVHPDVGILILSNNVIYSIEN